MSLVPKLSSLESLLRIRYFEENIAAIYANEYIRCPVHLAIGHEAVPVGICEYLNTSDLVLSYHRSHHHYLAKGGNMQALLWELLGDPRGCSGGHGGSTHLTDTAVGFVASTAIISGTLPIATGLAHSLKQNNSSSICVAFCGDAAIEEGVFFETLNIANLWSLPVLFVIEDNDMSCYTNKITRQSHQGFAEIAQLFKMNYSSIDGSSLVECSVAAKDAVNYVREYSKPALLHAKVFRALEHCGPEKDDLLAYRNTSEKWPSLDPVEKIKKYFSENEFNTINAIIKSEINLMFKNSLSQLKAMQ